MTHEEVREIIQKMQKDPKVLDLLKSYDQPEDELKLYGEIAEKLGYVESADEFTKLLEERKNSIIRKTDDTIENLPDADLKSVAGGKGEHNECKDTYKDKENCWHNDACDIVYHSYEGYQCHWANDCNNHALDCGNDASYYCPSGYF